MNLILLKVVLVRTANTSLQIEEAESVLPYRLYWNNNSVHIESNYPIESLSCVDFEDGRSELSAHSF